MLEIDHPPMVKSVKCERVQSYRKSLVFLCMAKISIPNFCRNILFYRLSNDSSSASLIGTLPFEKGMVSSDGTWRCLSILICVGCPDAFMTLCACPHVGHYLAGHLAVSYLMSSTTNLMRIKCRDSAYLLTRAARPRTMHPPQGGFDPCISPMIGDVLNALCFPCKFSPHTCQPNSHAHSFQGPCYNQTRWETKKRLIIGS